MASKFLKKSNKKEELIPSFLSGLTAAPENVDVLPKTVKRVNHLGPIFFGCHQHHPPPHSLNLGTFYHTQYTASSTENILRDIYFPQSASVRKCFKTKQIFRPFLKRRKLFTDPYPHKCSGTKKVFVPEVAPQVIDLGHSNSIIEGEMSMEIPLCRIKKTPVGETEANPEIIMPSDVWEKRRIRMSRKERMAHPHFPKQFVNVIIIGPTIPAGLSITKLPSKRKSLPDINLDSKSKEEKMIEVTEEIIEAAQKEAEVDVYGETESKESAKISSTEIQKINSVRFVSDEESEFGFEMEDEGFYEEISSVESLKEMEEQSEIDEMDVESMATVKPENVEEENFTEHSQE